MYIYSFSKPRKYSPFKTKSFNVANTNSTGETYVSAEFPQKYVIRNPLHHSVNTGNSHFKCETDL